MDTTNYIERSIRNAILQILMKKTNRWMWKQVPLKVLLFIVVFGCLSAMLYAIGYETWPRLVGFAITLIVTTGIISLTGHCLNIWSSRKYFDARVRWINEIKADRSLLLIRDAGSEEALWSLSDRNNVCELMINELVESRRHLLLRILDKNVADVYGYASNS